MSISAKITYVPAKDLLDEAVPHDRAPSPAVGRRRQLAGVALALVELPLLTLLLHGTRDALSLDGQVLVYLLGVVLIALVGGILVALFSAFAAAVLMNYYFVVPLHTLDVAHGDQAVALGVFVVVATIVSGAVELAARRARAAELAIAQADTLSELAGGDLDESETLGRVLTRARETFGMETVVLKARDRATGEWIDVERVGWSPGGDDAELRFDVPIGKNLRLIGRGPALFAEDRRVLRAFAAAAQTAYEGRQLSERAREGRDLVVVDRQRTALLAAVGHDLRTPLATIKASAGTLRQTDVDWSADEREQLLATIEQSVDRLDGVVANLLDASRLQTGALSVHASAVALDEAVGAAVLAVTDVGAGAGIDVEVPDDLPLVQADAGLLERVLVNLLDNALRHGASSDRHVEIKAYALNKSAKVEVIDHGPGVSRERRETLFEPFQGRDDHGSATGVGLGLSVARGFAEAMGGALAADTTPGGGLTMRLRLPLAAPPPPAAGGGEQP